MYSDTNSSSCMSFCPSGFYNSSGICIACPASCGNCFYSTTEGQAQCSSCGSGKILFNGQCLTTCPSGYFSTMIQNALSCSKCAPNCAECVNSSSTCTLCQNANYTIPNCVTQTCTSTQFENLDGSCGNCASTCGSCYGGSSYECITCAGGSFMLNGQCIAACPSGYYADGSTCRQCVQGCATCANTAYCTQCLTGYYIHFYSNYSVCVRDCSTINTATMSYIAGGLACLPCTSVALNCTSCAYIGNGTSCTACQSGYILYQG